MNPLLNPTPSSGTAAADGTGAKGSRFKQAGLLAAVAALLAVLWMPSAQGLPAAGQVMLAILAFAVIVWMTEALDYAVSSVVIGALMVFLLAYAPDAAKPAGADMGTVAST
ncbi:MAG: anion permease [Polaromonas sp.]|uniref:anion permease n=1 Tax=Polaromonas sp. TaxID=1869339 RepID=UPI0027360E3A|nr:anion permease [Polaromonas sp.]MDP2816892.1 anion permease [Polaromonas sp.]